MVHSTISLQTLQKLQWSWWRDAILEWARTEGFQGWWRTALIWDSLTVQFFQRPLATALQAGRLFVYASQSGAIPSLLRWRSDEWPHLPGTWHASYSNPYQTSIHLCMGTYHKEVIFLNCTFLPVTSSVFFCFWHQLQYMQWISQVTEITKAWGYCHEEGQAPYISIWWSEYWGFF